MCSGNKARCNGSLQNECKLLDASHMKHSSPLTFSPSLHENWEILLTTNLIEREEHE